MPRTEALPFSAIERARAYQGALCSAEMLDQRTAMDGNHFAVSQKNVCPKSRACSQLKPYVYVLLQTVTFQPRSVLYELPKRLVAAAMIKAPMPP